MNVIVYLTIAMSLYYLYSPMSNYGGNKTSSTVKFVYQQF